MTLEKDPERTETRYLHQFAEFADRRVLEVGCGEGRITWQYAKATQRTMGVDLDRDRLRVAKVDRPYDVETKALFACADSQNLPFAKEKFDLAVLAWSL